jgi:hypothetical protein
MFLTFTELSGPVLFGWEFDTRARATKSTTAATDRRSIGRWAIVTNLVIAPCNFVAAVSYPTVFGILDVR